MSVTVKELNPHRIADLTNRSDMNILTNFALQVILGYENEEDNLLPFSKAITSIYRVDKNTLTNANNQIVHNALIKTLGNNWKYPEDRNLHKHLMDYLSIKTAKRCPIAFDISKEHEDVKKGL